MNNLRNIAIAMLGVVLLLSVAGSVFAYYQLWQITAMLMFGAVVISVLTILLASRYLSWNARTGEQRVKVATQVLSARLKESMKQQGKANEELHSLIETLHEAQANTRQETQESLNAVQVELKSQIAEVNQAVAAHAKVTTKQAKSATLDATRQTESLVHLYQRFPNVKLPMPSTGGFAIDSQALSHLIALVEERRPRRILELGSGTSTIWLGYLCRSFGGTLVTLDHLEHYLEKTRTAIERHELGDVIDSRLAPLEPVETGGQTYNWYALSSMTDLADVDMVIIDGPPAATGPQARYPALPKVIELMSANATVVLDDAHRDDEARIVESWLVDYPEFREIEQGTSRLAVLERIAG